MVVDLSYEGFTLLSSLFSAQKCSVISSSSIPFTSGNIILYTFHIWKGFSVCLPPAFSFVSYIPCAHCQPFSLERIENANMEILKFNLSFFQKISDLDSSSLLTTNKIWKTQGLGVSLIRVKASILLPFYSIYYVTLGLAKVIKLT